MRIERVMRHPITPAELFEISLLAEYQNAKCKAAGALSSHVVVEIDGDTAVVRTRRKMPTIGFPSLIRKIVPLGVTTTETITWLAPDPDGSRDATIHVDFHGAPARMGGSMRLEPDGRPDASVLVIDADFTALVPLVGSRIEKLAAPIISSVLDAEEETGRSWVAESRGV
ncbi:MAG: DUF2505 domain-containing protein [Williamsia herbipolensis]|nr:DUF2505 domain-containing protein [Williamsia herbipolensis]